MLEFHYESWDLLNLCSWRMASYSLCNWFHSYRCEESCEDRIDRCWAYGEALSIFFHWSVGMDWGSPYILCCFIGFSNSIGDKNHNISSILACIHSFRLHDWFRVKFPFHHCIYIELFTLLVLGAVTFSFFVYDLEGAKMWYCHGTLYLHFIRTNYSYAFSYPLPLFSDCHQAWRRSSTQ